VLLEGPYWNTPFLSGLQSSCYGDSLLQQERRQIAGEGAEESYQTGT